jgi:hypothetical protein
MVRVAEPEIGCAQSEVTQRAIVGQRCVVKVKQKVIEFVLSSEVVLIESRHGSAHIARTDTHDTIDRETYIAL